MDSRARAAQEHYADFIAHSSEGIFRFESRAPVPLDLPEAEQVERIVADGVLVEANAAYARIYGAADPAALVGRPLLDFGGRDANLELTRLFVRSGYRINDLEWSERIAGEQRWFRGSFRGEVRGGRLHAAWGTQADITPRRLAEQELRASEERFRSLTALSSDWYWEQDAELRFVATAGRNDSRGGITAEQHVGLRRWELPGTEPLHGTWDEHRAQLEARRPFRDFMLKRTGNDGRLRFVAVSGEPVLAGGEFRGYRGIARDVTHEVEAAAARRASEERFRHLTHLSSDWYWEQDAELRFTYMSEELGAKTGIDIREHLGKRRWDMPAINLSAEDWARHRADLEARRPFRDLLIRRPDRDGRPIWVELSGDPVFDAAGRFTGYRGIGRNVTERVLLVEALRRSEAELEARVRSRTAELETALHELEAFSYSVSHDLRAPLRAIGGFARIVLRNEGERLSEEGRRRLGVVETNALRMGELVDDLLTLSRVSRRSLAPAPLDLRALCETVAAELRAQYPAAEVAIGALPAATGDATLLRQVLVNLLDNALKYSSKAPAPRVEVGWEEAARAYFVRDNGVGFDMAYAGKLFKSFERLHTDEEFPGQGIGLALARRIVERHGGRIWAQAAPGEGATFLFSLSGEQAAECGPVQGTAAAARLK